MSIKISQLSTVDPTDYPYYFLDANIWIAILKNNSKKVDRKLQPYISFFEAVVALNLHDEKTAKRLKCQPKIVMSGMLLSEIINAYLRNVAMPAFYLNSVSSMTFKRYREDPYSNYEIAVKSIADDITSFASSIRFIDDRFSTLDAFGMLKKLNRTVDFNDLYFQTLVQTHSDITIITEDKDYGFDSVQILTENMALLKKR